MTDRTCGNGDCGRAHYAKGLCRRCYDRLRNHGDPNSSGRVFEIVDGLRRSDWAKIDKRPNGCWLWTGAVARLNRYGRVTWRGVTQDAHRYVWLRLVGPLPDDLELDHLCRVRHCVNPDHLDPVVHRDNVIRGIAPSRYHAEKRLCPQGHEYTADPPTASRWHRRCLTCDSEAAKRRRATLAS